MTINVCRKKQPESSELKPQYSEEYESKTALVNENIFSIRKENFEVNLTSHN